MKEKAAVGRAERVQVMLTRDELEAVDNFRFSHRMPSRAAAVRELLRLALRALKEPRTGGGGLRMAVAVLVILLVTLWSYLF